MYGLRHVSRPREPLCPSRPSTPHWRSGKIFPQFSTNLWPVSRHVVPFSIPIGKFNFSWIRKTPRNRRLVKSISVENYGYVPSVFRGMRFHLTIRIFLIPTSPLSYFPSTQPSNIPFHVRPRSRLSFCLSLIHVWMKKIWRPWGMLLSLAWACFHLMPWLVWSLTALWCVFLAGLRGYTLISMHLGPSAWTWLCRMLQILCFPRRKRVPA